LIFHFGKYLYIVGPKEDATLNEWCHLDVYLDINYTAQSLKTDYSFCQRII